MTSDYIPLSLLSQHCFCERRAALMMLEGAWQDNEYTTEGTLAHERVHSQGIIKRGKVVTVYDFSVHSHNMKLSGKCDCIEATVDEDGIEFPFYSGKFTLFPIEYKRGVVRDEVEYNVQLCAQAICLEEMFGCKIISGAIFYINSHRRVDVDFDEGLRRKVKNTAEGLWEILDTKTIPPSVYTAKCKKCSIYEFCLPKIKNNAVAYNNALKQAAIGGDGF